MDECPGGEMWGDGGGQARTFVQEQPDDLEVCILDRLDERGIAIVILRVQVRDEGRYASIRGNRRTSRLQVDLGAVAQELRDSVEITSAHADQRVGIIVGRLGSTGHDSFGAGAGRDGR